MALITDVDEDLTEFNITHNEHQDELFVTWTAINNSFYGSRICVQIEQLLPSSIVADNTAEYHGSGGRMCGQYRIHTSQGRSYKVGLQLFIKKSRDDPEVQTHALIKFFVPESTVQRLFLICPQNRWNSSDCQQGLYILRDGLTVSRHKLGSPRAAIFTSVRAEMLIPQHYCGLFYFEVKLERMFERFRFGLMPKSVSLNTSYASYSYKSDGTFWGHNVAGCDFANAWPFVTNKESEFGSDDIVGCGLNMATRQMIYTLNGRRLNTTDLLVHQSDLCPFISLNDAGDAAKANFGPEFKYDLEEEYLTIPAVQTIEHRTVINQQAARANVVALGEEHWQPPTELEQLYLICPKNRWNSFDCHSDLFVIRPDCRTVFRHDVSSPDACAVRAEIVIPRHHCGLFYFEVKVEEMRIGCRFGLMPKKMGLNSASHTSFSYRSDGTFWGHGVPGSVRVNNWPYVTNKDAKFGVGDIVGCGLNMASRQMIYTLNGRRLSTSGLLVPQDDKLELYPFISLKDAEDRVMGNFGPHFRFNLAEEYLIPNQ
uniref:B30.2/SPRY domain-containing protein n=1 Tax=Globodera rostochiensis TaxID=31243 RepID=A0A914HQN3_GLORO